MKKIAFVLGTRPEIIKLWPLIDYCKRGDLDYIIIHTNQHYSENMDKIFFEELDLPQAKYNLAIQSSSHGDATGRMMQGVEKIFMQESPDIVFVQGDTNTVLAGALVASKIDSVLLAHVEAGLRSYDRSMPEEINRIVVDHISDKLFTPTEKQKEILMHEGVKEKVIHVSGNTIVDAVYMGRALSQKKSRILEDIAQKEDAFILFTAHRPATVDNKENISEVIKAVAVLAEKHSKTVIMPLHPRTQKMITTFGIPLPESMIIIEPVGYLDMLKLQQSAFLVITDSGGLQEESCILEKKCAVIRENTERPEAVDVGGCVLVGNTDAQKIVRKCDELIQKDVKWSNPFGDGKAAEKIIEAII